MNKNDLHHLPSKSFIATSTSFYIDSNMIQIWSKGVSVKEYEESVEYFIPWEDIINHIKAHGMIVEGRLNF